MFRSRQQIPADEDDKGSTKDKSVRVSTTITYRPCHVCVSPEDLPVEVSEMSSGVSPDTHSIQMNTPCPHKIRRSSIFFEYPLNEDGYEECISSPATHGDPRTTSRKRYLTGALATL